MPRPVRELVRLVHIEHIDLAKARGEDFQVAGYLRARKPDLYRRLRDELRALPARRSGRRQGQN